MEVEVEVGAGGGGGGKAQCARQGKVWAGYWQDKTRGQARQGKARRGLGEVQVRSVWGVDVGVDVIFWQQQRLPRGTGKGREGCGWNWEMGL